MYKLRKISIDKGAISALEAGYTSELPNLKLFDYETDEVIPIEDIKRIAVGWQIYLTDGITNFHRTSKIREVVSREKNKIVFKTQTSLYELIQQK